MEEVVPVLLLRNNSKNQRSSNTSQLRIFKQAVPMNLNLLNKFKWRMFNKGNQAYHRDKQLLSHQWQPESLKISLCHHEDPRVVPAVQYADHLSNLQQHP